MKVKSEFNERVTLVIRSICLKNGIKFADFVEMMGENGRGVASKLSCNSPWTVVDIQSVSVVLKCEIINIFMDAATLDLANARKIDAEAAHRKMVGMAESARAKKTKSITAKRAKALIDTNVQKTAEANNQNPKPKAKIKWLTRKQAASRLGISISYVDDLANDGKLRRYKIGERIIRFRQDELDDDISQMIDEQGICQ